MWYLLCMSPQKPEQKTWWVPKDWGEEQALRIAQAIRRLRGNRSAQWVANRTTELGYTVSRSVIADLENGRRRYVTTGELAILAAALDTAPVALLYPPPYDEEIEMRPGETVTKLTAAQIFSGYPGDDYPAEYRRNVEPLRQARQIDGLERRQAELLRDMDRLVEDGSLRRNDPEAARQFRNQMLEWITGQLLELKVDDGG